MYVVKLGKESTNHAGTYIKRALIVVTDFDEYTQIMTNIETVNARLRRKCIYYSNNITQFVPNNGSTWLIYVEYRYKEVGDWEQDLLAIFATTKPRIRAREE